jgi:D-glycero-D-manno-heptose 1,7-bisphosphate phosphatase
MSRAAVFLDRDGVLNEVVERAGLPGSPRSVSELRLVPDVAHARRLKEAGLLVFIVTNQPDRSRGELTQEALDAMMAAIRAVVPVDDYRVCVHEDADDCACRKPRPGMLLDLAHHWHLDLSRSVVVGDMWRDVEAARAAGCRSILIRRPYNRGVSGDAEADSLAAAVDIVLEERG